MTATLTDGVGVWCVVVRPLPPREATAAIARLCDRLSLHVVTLSTPGTILSDLLGRKPGGRGDLRRTRSLRPEEQMLGHIGRLDLLWRPEDAA